MKKTLLILLSLAACGRGDAPPDNRAMADSRSAATDSKAARADAPAGVRLAGLYEGGAGAQKNQLCIVETGKAAQFGLIVWGSNLHSCSGAGQAVRDGDRLTLKMAGDEACAIEASLKGGTVALPAKVPEGCAYYCGARATLAGARFTRSGDNVRKATDIAGDPLCD